MWIARIGPIGLTTADGPFRAHSRFARAAGLATPRVRNITNTPESNWWQAIAAGSSRGQAVRAVSDYGEGWWRTVEDGGGWWRFVKEDRRLRWVNMRSRASRPSSARW